jgi:hypothetical protein
LRPENGAALVGLKTTVLAIISAPAHMLLARATGKLNGEMTAQVPYGLSTLTHLSFLTGDCILVRYPSFASSWSQ